MMRQMSCSMLDAGVGYRPPKDLVSMRKYAIEKG